MKTQKTGQLAEDLALKFLQKNKLKLLQRNFLCKLGEIDLIMENKAAEIIFVEVRFRKNESHGGAIMSVTPSKQQKIIRAAQLYLQKNNLHHRICRFDVVAISLQNDKPVINWIENAFIT